MDFSFLPILYVVGSKKYVKTLIIIGTMAKKAKSEHIVDVLPAVYATIEMILFALCLSSQDTNWEYPEHIVQKTI